MAQLIHPRSIVILDFGGQYAHLIGNRIRRLGAFSEVHEPETPAEELKDAAGIILSGGPQSVYAPHAPTADHAIFDLGIPVLGICYGHQWMAHALGGEVREGEIKEYGESRIRVTDEAGPLFNGLDKDFTVWMSHGDEVSVLPEGFQTTATSDVCAIAAMADQKRRLFGLQFHPEVTHTEHGTEIIQNFVALCNPAPWSVGDFAEHIGDQVKHDVGNRKVFMLISGGVDSTVAFTLLEKTLGKDRAHGLLVDTGLMRKDEVRNALPRLSLGNGNLHVEDASDLFFERLKKLYDPEEKRRAIGETFLEVQRSVAKRLKLDGPEWVFGQGTIYPDTIETGGTKHADTIKTHHNRIPEIKKMMEEGRVVEPLKDLYKDEVRELGELLGLPRDLVWRHPFPGPGLGVRIICALKPECAKETEETTMQSRLYAFRVLPIRSVGVQGDGRSYKHPLAIFLREPTSDLRSVHGLATSIPNAHSHINRVIVCTSHHEPPGFVFTPTTITRDLVTLLQEADHIVDREMRAGGLYEKIWQFPVVLIPIGIEEGGHGIVLRPVESQEAMTANAFHLSEEFLARVTKKLLELDGIDMVFYDCTNKPPATIEWE